MSALAVNLVGAVVIVFVVVWFWIIKPGE